MKIVYHFLSLEIYRVTADFFLSIQTETEPSKYKSVSEPKHNFKRFDALLLQHKKQSKRLSRAVTNAISFCVGMQSVKSFISVPAISERPDLSLAAAALFFGLDRKRMDQ